jgi:hypothetical protein
LLNSKLKAREADIIATGMKKPNYIATGVLFECENEYKSVLIFDDSLSKEFYSYFVVNDNVGEITCVNPVNHKDANRYIPGFIDSDVFIGEKSENHH